MLYDEPTTGLDPITALTDRRRDHQLRDLDEVSSIVVTHQLRDAFHIATHEADRPRRLRFDAASDEKSRNGVPHVERGARALRRDAAELRASADPYCPRVRSASGTQGSHHMPRTRSIAWSELKVGVVGVVAVVLSP